MSSVKSLLAEHSLVTFRFYAQEAGVPASEAKDALRSYAEAHPGEVHVVHLLGGVRKAEGGEGALEYKLVPEAELEEAKALFEPLTACHPYSLHATPPTSGEPLFLLNHTLPAF